MTSPSTYEIADPMPGPPARRIGPRTVVSSLWLFAILNYAYCDILGLYWSEDLAALLTGEIHGIRFTQGFLLGAAILMTIPIGAVLVSRIAPHRVARWSSLAAGIVMTLVQAASLTVGSEPTLHYIYFSIIEITTTATIAWYAATRWRRDT
ncbi:DUF6326 family protein [Couchioplanes azureus]|uniref:DUF6326 family protein n=1 Tax=Couchioplanes caeruleus TaxID=56438 RepID=UPI0019BA9ACE|nr:DUF6326 family protein [Couchioplanes caeruleus]GGQ63598.1 hypothetical protein GCM10010166_36760 [Couchioplanes caeruleus subsp. azureus]